MIAKNTFSQGQGGSKSGQNQKKFNFEFCYQKAFQGCNEKNPWCDPLSLKREKDVYIWANQILLYCRKKNRYIEKINWKKDTNLELVLLKMVEVIASGCDSWTVSTTAGISMGAGCTLPGIMVFSLIKSLTIKFNKSKCSSFFTGTVTFVSSAHQSWALMVERTSCLRGTVTVCFGGVQGCYIRATGVDRL